MEILPGRRQGEGVDGKTPVFDSHRNVGASEEMGDVLISAAQIEETGDGFILLAVREKIIDQKALAAAGTTQNDRVGDIPVVQVKEIRRSMVGFEYGKVLRAPQVRVLRFPE